MLINKGLLCMVGLRIWVCVRAIVRYVCGICGCNDQWVKSSDNLAREFEGSRADARLCFPEFIYMEYYERIMSWTKLIADNVIGAHSVTFRIAGGTAYCICYLLNVWCIILVWLQKYNIFILCIERMRGLCLDFQLLKLLKNITYFIRHYIRCAFLASWTDSGCTQRYGTTFAKWNRKFLT